MSKKNIAVIFGGRSAEHDVSIITAHIPIIRSLEVSGKYNVVPVYISKDGKWYSERGMDKLDYFKDQNYEKKLLKCKPFGLLIDRGLNLVKFGIRQQRISIDMVFPAMHGTFGEDGSLMGLLRMANVPFVGCDLFASAVSMDKVLSKQVLSAENISVVPYYWFTGSEWADDKNNLIKKIKKLNWPLIVKPVHLGSSIGITKVSKIDELENAVEVALHYDDKVLVERYISDLTEVTLPIMGNDIPIASLLERPLNKEEIFDFKEKYLYGSKKVNDATSSKYSELPARIGDKLTKQVKRIGLDAYRILGCTGIARIDFLIDNKTDIVYVNEVNTLPGSLYHHNWKMFGISNVDLVNSLVELAEEKFDKNKSLTRTFKSDILRMTGGSKLS